MKQISQLENELSLDAGVPLRHHYGFRQGGGAEDDVDHRVPLHGVQVKHLRLHLPAWDVTYNDILSDRCDIFKGLRVKAFHFKLPPFLKSFSVLQLRFPA